MRQFYILRNGIEPEPCAYATWLAWVEGGGDRAICETELPGARIITKFPGFDLTGDGFFQTQVCGMKASGMVARYETFDDAVVGHARMVEQVRRQLAEPPEA
jgi:hypothetical protein